MSLKIFGKNFGVIAPHPDDEVLGCGGLINKLIKNNINVHVLFVSGHLPPVYSKEDYNQTVIEAKNAAKILGIKSIEFLEIPATTIHNQNIVELNGKISNFVINKKIDSLAIPFPDRHIDHKTVFEASMVVSRPKGKYFPKLVFCYETLSETNWNAPYIEPNFFPNFFVNITNEMEIKKKAIKSYASQTENVMSRGLGAVEALAKFRGTQNDAEYCEAFKVIRLLI